MYVVFYKEESLENATKMLTLRLWFQDLIDHMKNLGTIRQIFLNYFRRF